MKHYILISIISLLSVTAIISNTIKLVSTDGNKSTTNITSEADNITYTIRDYNGRIALFENSNPNPKTVYEIFTASLPQADKEMLINGISVTSEEEAKRLIEEYTS